MARPKQTDTQDAEPKEATGTVADDQLEHTEGGATTRDPMDQGVPMTQGQPTEKVGPEDALGAGPKRGDYRERLETGPRMKTVEIPESERLEMAGEGGDLADVPRFRTVPADETQEIGDAPGKGGVTTAQALVGVSGEPEVAREAIVDGTEPTPEGQGSAE